MRLMAVGIDELSAYREKGRLMSADKTLNVFDAQSFSIHDGPGIRRSIFLKGCPLRCKWCHSPESQDFKTRILWLGVKCVGCLACVQACPKNARSYIKLDNGKLKITCDWDTCTECGACVRACLTQALYYCGKEQTIDEIMMRIEREKPVYDKSGGGVTVSGGECLCQIDGVVELLKRCKEMGIHTAVDTCGFVPYESIGKALPYTDLFLYDLKHMDSKAHKEGTGVPNELILENALKLAGDGGRFQIRIPLITGFNTSDENIEATCKFISKFKDSVETVQLLPYHSLGISKWDRMSMDGPDFDVVPPSDELVKAIYDRFAEAGFSVGVH